jgi:hypothetical protein
MLFSLSAKRDANAQGHSSSCQGRVAFKEQLEVIIAEPTPAGFATAPIPQVTRSDAAASLASKNRIRLKFKIN